ncbi:MAG: 3-deoxy-D-manno-octulosonic acid transferase, partial [Candidatus Omnitrophica bacterium]|nr:3-deoxy-D-manno-octulosonic acid transferase [Candidatus Omnitrophota bacterium]
MRILYEIVLVLYIVGYFPILLLRGKWHGGFGERFGFISREALQRLSQSSNIWVHAVSVGEVMAVGGLIRQLKLRFPRHQIVLTTATRTGYELSQKKLSKEIMLLWAPIDLSASVLRFIKAIKPKIYVAAETELWPNLFYYLHRNRIPIVVVNGRISDKSLYQYLRIRWFMRHFLKCANAYCMQSALDVQRIVAIGAPTHCVK